MDIKEGKFSITYLPERDDVVNKTNNYALIQLDGFLSYITCDSEATMDVWILEDFHGQVWSKKHTIVAELTHYVCPSKSTRPNERSMPEIGKLVAVGGARNGEVLILKHQKNSKQYLYYTKSRVLGDYWYTMSPNESKCCRSLIPDVLSNLPDNVIDVILMCLPCKDAVRTSILSKKWRYKWCRRTEFTLDKSHWVTKNDLLHPTIKFKKIICQFLTLHEGPITKFTLDIVNLENSPEIDNFIYFLSRNGIQHLVLHLSFDNPYKLPSSVFTCSQLRHLSLHNCSIHHSSAFKGFNRLISLELCEVIISSELLESLIYHCPLLEQLMLVILENLDTIEINVPTLRTLDFTGYISSICLKNSPRLVKLSLEGRYMEVEDLDFAKVFESCSALEHLLFDFSNFELYSEDEEDDRILECLELQRFSDVTFNHLREVKLKCFGGTTPEMQLIKLLLAKSPVLVRMLIDRWFLEHGSLDTRLRILNETQVPRISIQHAVDPAEHSRVSDEPPCFPEDSVISFS
uniref:Ubiquitin-protein ligase n=1 Tax=Solanum tuberosum TaxID=4113 RepID=M1BTE4_SOLTU